MFSVLILECTLCSQGQRRGEQRHIQIRHYYVWQILGVNILTKACPDQPAQPGPQRALSEHTHTHSHPEHINLCSCLANGVISVLFTRLQLALLLWASGRLGGLFPGLLPLDGTLTSSGGLSLSQRYAASVAVRCGGQRTEKRSL